MPDKVKVIITNEQKEVKIPTGMRMLVRRCCTAVLTLENFEGSAEVDVRFVNVCRHQKGVLSLRKAHGQFIADFIGFFRRDFSRLEGLANLIGNHIMLLCPSGHLQILAFGEKEFLIGSLRVTLVGADIFATVGFLCIL